MIRVYLRRIPKALPLGVRTAAELQHRVAWSLLCDVLQQEYGIAPSEQQFARTQEGKPYLVSGKVAHRVISGPRGQFQVRWRCRNWHPVPALLSQPS